MISEKVEFHLSITIQSPYSSHLSMECSLKFWKYESGLFSVLISDGWHPDPSGLPQLFGWNSQVRWETTRDEKRLFENCEPCKRKQTSYLKIFNLRCICKWLALSNQHHQRAIDPSLVNDNNAERIIGLGHTEHTALIIPRACQNVEGRFIMEAKSTGKIFLILISLIMKWLKQRGMRKRRISKSFCL